MYVHLSLLTSHFKVTFKHTGNIFVCFVSPLELFHSKDNVGQSIILVITTQKIIRTLLQTSLHGEAKRKVEEIHVCRPLQLY